jgi:taurine dioxygenase
MEDMMGIEIRPIDDHVFAREVIGAQLWRDFEPADLKRIRVAWAEAGVVVFRRQALSEQELVNFSRRLGIPQIVHRRDWVSPEHPEVIFISNLHDREGNNIGMAGTGDLEWHTDQSYILSPTTGSVLYGVEIPNDGGGSTWWANLRLAYAALPADLKAAIEEKRAVFDYLKRFAGSDEGARSLTEDMRQKTPPVTHSLVHVHPVTGRKSLYFDPWTMTGIAGMEPEAAMNILRRLQEFATRPEFTYEHKWQVGDVVMWDNGFMLHRRDAYDPNQRRFHKRTTIALSPECHIVPKGELLNS